MFKKKKGKRDQIHGYQRWEVEREDWMKGVKKYKLRIVR